MSINRLIPKQSGLAMVIASLLIVAQGSFIQALAMKTLQVRQGNALVNPDQDTAVEMSQGLLVIKPSAQAFVMNSNDDTTIFALNQKWRGDIKVIVDKKAITLEPGQELLITRKKGLEFDALNPAKVIPYRILSQHELDDGARIFNCEYSIFALVRAVKPLKSKLSSSSAQDQAMMKQILKNALILSGNNSQTKFASSLSKTK